MEKTLTLINDASREYINSQLKKGLTKQVIKHSLCKTIDDNYLIFKGKRNEEYEDKDIEALIKWDSAKRHLEVLNNHF